MEPESRIVRPGHFAVIPKAQFRIFQKSPMPERRKTAMSGSFTGAIAVHPPRSESFANLQVGPARSKAGLSSVSIFRPGGLVHTEIPRTTTSEPHLAVPQKSNPRLQATFAGSLAPGRLAVQPLGSMPFRLHDLHDSDPNVELYSAAFSSNKVNPRPAVYSSQGRGDPRQSPTIQPQLPYEDLGDRQSHDAQPQKPSISTLHIDGAALGRWAIQHLERALGKPATGMTGVDPRATAPRGRVAPF